MRVSLYQKTPAITVLSNRGQSVREIQYYRHPDTPDTTETRITRHQYDARSLLAQSIDPRLYALQQTDGTVKPNFTYLNTLGGEVLRTQSCDAGTTLILNDTAGRAFLAITAAGTDEAMTRSWQYEDSFLPGRVLSITEQTAGGESRIQERFIWAGNTQAEKDLNLTGQCVSHYDTAGLIRTDSVALSGVPLSVTRQLVKNAAAADTVIDWQEGDEPAWNDQLAQESYRTLSTADATGSVLTSTDAKGNVQRMAYDVAGLLKGSWLTLKGAAEQVIVKSLTYSAVGQKLREEHGNGVVTTYTREPQTQRLTEIKTERPSRHAAGAKVLQDLRYEYDPVGNVVKVTSASEATRFWRNQKVLPENTYGYDSLYQLVSASGREMANAGQQGSALPAVTVPLPADDTLYTNYTRRYTYDSGSNLTQIRHSAPASGNSYTTCITVSHRSNRALLSTLTEDPSKVDAFFTGGGHQGQLQPGQNLVWTARGELHQVTPVMRDGQLSDSESCRYDAASQRVLKTTVQQTDSHRQTRQTLYLPDIELRMTATDDRTKEILHTLSVGEAGRAQVRVLHWESEKPHDISNDQLRYSYDSLTGSSGLEVDANGEIISREEYYPYGGTAVWAARSQTEADYKTVHYSGKERDATGLYYYGYRYYQPWVGRWLSADPAGTVDGLNLYRMVRNNPLTLRDDDGCQPVSHLTTFQDVFYDIHTRLGLDEYNATWYAFNASMPLMSSDPIDAQSRKKVNDFAEKYRVVKNMVFVDTTTPGVSFDTMPVKIEMTKLPLNIIEKLHSLGQYIIVTDDNVTNSQIYAHLKKELPPRGWEAGKTWEDVPGMGAPGKKVGNYYPNATAIAMTQKAASEWIIPATGHGSTSLVLHEFSHAIDRSFGELAGLGKKRNSEEGDFFSTRDKFRRAWKKDLSATLPDSESFYYWQNGSDGGAEEAFAEALSDMYSETNKHNWPNIKNYLTRAMQSIK